jgi:hypothetical protein
MKISSIKQILLVWFITLFCNISHAQISTYTFIDPCTKEVTNFSIPLQGGKTMFIFLDNVNYFDANDLANGTFANWVNQSYKKYRLTNPCSQQQGQVTQNQLTTQIISGTVQSLVSSILSSNQSQSSSTESSSASGNGNNSSENKDNKSSEKTSSSQTTGQQQQQQSTTGSNNGQGGGSSSGGSSSGSGTGKTSGQNGTGTGSDKDNSSKQENGEEVGATIAMNTDAQNDKGGSKGSSGRAGNSRSNPLIVSSDITSAQNLNGTFTAIVNVGTNKSSMTGLSSYGVTGMVWMNFRQFAISTKYTKIHFNKSKKIKFIHNFNLTGVYTYENYLGFIGYSGIMNGGKYGIAGFNISAAATVIAMEKSGYYSPSITGFYTKPFKVGKKIIVSPELYIISTPLIYSTKERVSISDRYISGFVGSGFDYQISKRFKVNLNYKANMSTNPDFPILSFFLIGSKVNL